VAAAPVAAAQHAVSLAVAEAKAARMLYQPWARGELLNAHKFVSIYVLAYEQVRNHDGCGGDEVRRVLVAPLQGWINQRSQQC
jgi:hypothetical protein